VGCFASNIGCFCWSGNSATAISSDFRQFRRPPTLMRPSLSRNGVNSSRLLPLGKVWPFARLFYGNLFCWIAFQNTQLASFVSMGSKEPWRRGHCFLLARQLKINLKMYAPTRTVFWTLAGGGNNRVTLQKNVRVFKGLWSIVTGSMGVVLEKSGERRKQIHQTKYFYCSSNH